MSLARGMYPPRAVAVEVNDEGVPRKIGAVKVETIREDWLVEDRWWTELPLRRHYFELALADGKVVVVFRDLVAEQWLRQPA